MLINYLNNICTRKQTDFSSSTPPHCRLMGSMALSNHYRSEDLLDIETAAGGFQQRKGMRQCLPLTFCFHTGLSQYMALESTEGRTRSEIFYQCPVRSPPSDHNNLPRINTHSCRAGKQFWKVQLWSSSKEAASGYILAKGQMVNVKSLPTALWLIGAEEVHHIRYDVQVSTR